jgi:hypothetical protein
MGSVARYWEPWTNGIGCPVMSVDLSLQSLPCAADKTSVGRALDNGSYSVGRVIWSDVSPLYSVGTSQRVFLKVSRLLIQVIHGGSPIM